MKALAVMMLIALTGCSLAPDRVSQGWTHVSHPLKGFPFGPSTEEDTLDVADIECEWKRGRYTVELSLGYQLADGGFAGDDFIFRSRVAVDVWAR